MPVGEAATAKAGTAGVTHLVKSRERKTQIRGKEGVRAKVRKYSKSDL